MSKVLFMVALLAGCSLAFQSRPIKGVARAQSGCSTSHAQWIADAIGVGAGVAAMTLSVINRNDAHANIYGGVGAMGSVLYAASMGNGIRWRRECAATERQDIAAR